MRKLVAVGALLAALAIVGIAAGVGRADDGRRAELAPIDEVDIRIAESMPPQYFLHIVAGLPSGCAERDRHEVSREGDVITVTVWNTMPSGEAICTMIYGMYEIDVALGSDFEPGETYTVRVNDQVTTFRAQ